MGARRTIPPEQLKLIERRLLQAESPNQIVEDLSERWGKSRRTLWGYLAIVRKRLAEQAKCNPDPLADVQIARNMLLNAYRVAEKGSPKFGSDGRTMVQAARVYAEVTGALAPQQINHNVNAGIVILPELEAGVVAPESGTTDKVSGK